MFPQRMDCTVWHFDSHYRYVVYDDLFFGASAKSACHPDVYEGILAIVSDVS